MKRIRLRETLLVTDLLTDVTPLKSPRGDSPLNELLVIMGFKNYFFENAQLKSSIE
jgi:hypothetical protein